MCETFDLKYNLEDILDSPDKLEANLKQLEASYQRICNFHATGWAVSERQVLLKQRKEEIEKHRQALKQLQVAV